MANPIFPSFFQDVLNLYVKVLFSFEIPIDLATFAQNLEFSWKK